jgi:hypothetical protein
MERDVPFIPPCLPSPTDSPPVGPGWLHEIKHDGFRLMARRDAAGVRLLTRNGHDWAHRFPLIHAAVEALQVTPCLIDGEAVCCDDDGLAVFERLSGRPHDRRLQPHHAGRKEGARPAETSAQVAWLRRLRWSGRAMSKNTDPLLHPDRLYGALDIASRPCLVPGQPWRVCILF